MNDAFSPAEQLVASLARELHDGGVVATGVASSLPILAIAVAKATHAPRLTYLACVGALDPTLDELHACSEDLRYLRGRQAEVTIPELFDHARRGRIDTVFFGAAEVDAYGQTNMSALGSAHSPTTKLPGVAGAATLRRWVRHPVLLMPKQSTRNTVPKVQVASTKDPSRRTLLITDLGVLEVGEEGATVLSVHPEVTLTELRARTGFEVSAPSDVSTTPAPDAATLAAIRRLDPRNLRDRWVGRTTGRTHA